MCGVRPVGHQIAYVIVDPPIVLRLRASLGTPANSRWVACHDLSFDEEVRFVSARHLWSLAQKSVDATPFNHFERKFSLPHLKLAEISDHAGSICEAAVGPDATKITAIGHSSLPSRVSENPSAKDITVLSP